MSYDEGSVILPMPCHPRRRKVPCAPTTPGVKWGDPECFCSRYPQFVSGSERTGSQAPFGGRWFRGFTLLVSSPLAATGLVVAAIGQRVGEGFPYTFAAPGHQLWHPLAQSYAAEFNGDPDAVGGIGYSSGGHTLPLAAMRIEDPRYSALPLEGSTPDDAKLAWVISCWPVIEPYLRYEIARERGTTELMEKHHIFFQGDEAMHESTPLNVIKRGDSLTLPRRWFSTVQRMT